MIIWEHRYHSVIYKFILDVASHCGILICFRKQPHYKCDALQKFVNTCMKGFENLDIYSVATMLKGLFDR